jgi:hypothetical protein
MIAAVNVNDTSVRQGDREKLLSTAEQVRVCAQHLEELAGQVARLRERLCSIAGAELTEDGGSGEG